MTIQNKIYLLLPLALFTVALFIHQFIVFNITPSMRKGIYLKLSGNITKGDTVLFCLDQKNQRFGLMRHYLEQGHACNGAAPLIKEIVAIPGDLVGLTDSGLTINNKFSAYQTLQKDSFSRSLPIYPRAHYFPTTGYWVVGTHATNSWDSRYWGPIQHYQIIAKLVPLITWN